MGSSRAAMGSAVSALKCRPQVAAGHFILGRDMLVDAEFVQKVRGRLSEAALVISAMGAENREDVG